MSDMYTDLAEYFQNKRYLPLIFVSFIIVLGVAIYLSYVDFMTSVEGYRMLGVQTYGKYEAYAAGFIPQAWQIVVGLSTAGLIAVNKDSYIGGVPIKMSRVMGFAALLLFFVDFGTDVYYKVGGNFNNIPLVISAALVSFVFFTIGSEVMLVFSFSMTLALWRAGGKSVGNVIGTFVDGILGVFAGIGAALTSIMKLFGGMFVNKSAVKGGQASAPRPPQTNLPVPGVGGGGSRTPQAGVPKPPQPAGPQIRSAEDLEKMMRQQQQAQSQGRGGRQKPPKRR